MLSKRFLRGAQRFCKASIMRKMKRYIGIGIVILFIVVMRQMMNYHTDEAQKVVNDYKDNDYLHHNKELVHEDDRDVVHNIVDNNFQDKIPDKKIEDIRKRTGLSTNDTEFLLDGKSFRMLSGEIHYFRFPHEYWKDRLLALKACGLNTVTTYIPWNSHEPREGSFDFSGMLDLPRFIKIADDLGIHVILRIGPYICAEWEYGGLPSWLLRGGDIKIRSSDPIFINYVREWFDKLLPIIKPFQYTYGGPVIAVQVENEYSSFPYPDPMYIKKLKDMVIQRDIEEFLFVCDDRNGIMGNDRRINYVGMLKTINIQNKPAAALAELRKHQPKLPMFVSEYWTGWFDWWGGPHHNLGVPWLNSFDVKNFRKTTEELLSTGASMNLYVFAGGTNFGFMNGGIVDDKDRGVGDRVSADTTSYDYSAPVSEEGRMTEKYFAMRSILQEMYPAATFPNPPPQPVLASYGSAQVTEYVSLGPLLGAFKSWMIKSKNPIPMEQFPMKIDRKEGQSYGYAMYECTLTGKYQFKLDLSTNVRDRALIFLDTIYQDTLTPPMSPLTIRAKSDTKHTVSILVENQGRINWVAKTQRGIMENQNKGIFGDVKCNDEVLLNWRIWPLEFDSQFLRKLNQHSKDGTLEWKKFDYTRSNIISTPVLLRATLEVGPGEPKDTFVELEGFEKGVLIVNGVNLGRYWNSAGPQKRLYLPGVWLRPGTNEILVFEERIVGTVISFHTSSGLS